MVAQSTSPPAPTWPKISAIISAHFCTFIAAAAAIAKKIYPQIQQTTPHCPVRKS